MAARLVQQVQSIDGQVVHAYDIRARARMEIRPEVFSEVRRAMVQVVESKMGTAGRAQVDGVRVAGKTGTAQWGAKPHERTAAWFAGFAPADRPKYAFAAIYEGDVGRDEVHGGTFAAPIVGKVLREVLKPEPKKKKDAAPEVIDGVQVLRAQPVRPEAR
jgi:penicillin-binding protein 2